MYDYSVVVTVPKINNILTSMSNISSSISIEMKLYCFRVFMMNFIKGLLPLFFFILSLLSKSFII